MIDLSFLKEEEQETILTVLKRDAELKKAEEKRIQNLQRTMTNKSQLRYLTGEWFYETKQLRHQDRIHGSDIIRASMKQSQKPLTILELTHILPARPSFVSSEHKDVFVPSVLCGILEDPEKQPIKDRNQIHSNCATMHDTHKTASQSPVKMRKNPFNTDLTPEKWETHNAESRLSPNSLISMAADPKENVDQNVGISEKGLKSISSQETFANVKGSSPVDQMAVSKNGSSSATQLLFSPVDPQSPVNLATELWSGSKKTLRSDSQIRMEGQDGKELEVYKLMNVKPSAPCKEQNSSDLGSTRSTITGTHKLFHQQSPQELREGGENETNFQENGAGQQQVSGAYTSTKSKTMKSSCSVFDLQKDEMDNDRTFQKNPSSYMSDLSLSSGMTSVSSSRSSLYPLDSADVQGSIQFAVNYIQKLEELQIFVVLCRALATADNKKKRSDPYVKCYLFPDKTRLGKRKTSIRKKTINPSYNEILRFKILMDDLKTQSLNVSVWHNDSFGRNSFLGELDLDLSEWDFSNTEINEYTLKNRVSSEIAAPSTLPLTDSGGQMRVALKFVPQSQSGSGLEAGELMVWVKDCRNLTPVKGVIINPFVKCVVLPDMSRKSRQKTRVVKKTANPMFNHTMVYDGFRPEDLKETCVELTVWDHERLSNNFIGGVRLSPGTGKSYDVEVTWMDSTTNEVILWHKMLQSNGEWVEDVLPLRMLVMAKVMSK
ncbi:synaptotagmin-like protein 2 isoform X2 [Kryptolebias marmoratus]|uniref:synaptotagmin-like protein 2 isoform X2 n=1 Tax=Kryptolebias marmoratus TaxID=37003 RepID=UPI0007F86AB3|nr:synaptotagmin-like protein 2 isoform X2 [Kryptolebias marmoratus]